MCAQSKARDQLGTVSVSFPCPFGLEALGSGGGMGPGKYVPSNIFSRRRVSSGVDGVPPLTTGCSGVGVIFPLVWPEILSAFDGATVADRLSAAGTVVSCTVLLQAVIARSADANKKENPNVFFKITSLRATDGGQSQPHQVMRPALFHRYLVYHRWKSLVSRPRPKIKRCGSLTPAAFFV